VFSIVKTERLLYAYGILVCYDMYIAIRPLPICLCILYIHALYVMGYYTVARLGVTIIIYTFLFD